MPEIKELHRALTHLTLCLKMKEPPRCIWQIHFSLLGGKNGKKLQEMFPLKIESKLNTQLVHILPLLCCFCIDCVLAPMVLTKLQRTNWECLEHTVNAMKSLTVHDACYWSVVRRHDLKAETNITDTVQLWSGVRQAGLGRKCQILVGEAGYAEIQWGQVMCSRCRTDSLQEYCLTRKAKPWVIFSKGGIK